MNLLRKLAAARLPCTEADPAMIDRLRVLEAADHIKVLIPPAHMDCDHCLRQDPATVLAITPRGWKALSTDAKEDEVPSPAMPRSAARGSRPKGASAALDLAQLAAWFSVARRRSGD